MMNNSDWKEVLVLQGRFYGLGAGHDPNGTPTDTPIWPNNKIPRNLFNKCSNHVFQLIALLFVIINL